MTDARSIAVFLDHLLNNAEVEDYEGALNGLQITNDSPITKIACTVDFSVRTIQGCLEAGANFLIVHHGMFWGGPTAFVGSAYTRIKLLAEHGIAVYSSHLPLDCHPTLGNNILLARELQLEPSGGFAYHKGVAIGLWGECDLPTSELVTSAGIFARKYGGEVKCTTITADRRTRRWGMCTGAGASADTLAEAGVVRLDTLLVGEGPHWTAVAAEDDGIAVIYAGHYATETLGVQAIAKTAAEKFDLTWKFVHAPTGL